MNPVFAPTSPATVPLGSFAGAQPNNVLIVSPRDPASGLPSGKRGHAGIIAILIG